MKKYHARTSLLTVMTLLGVVGVVLANPDWNAGSPSQGAPGSQGILVSGTFTPNAPYQTTGAARINFWPAAGGQKTLSAFGVQAGQTGLVNWSFGVMGLPSGQTYNFAVEIDVIDPTTMNTATYETDTKQQTVP